MVRFEFQVSTAAKKYVCQSLITFRIKTKGFQELVKYNSTHITSVLNAFHSYLLQIIVRSLLAYLGSDI